MIAVNCTVTRGEAAVCVVFNVVCGRVRFNYDREGPDRRRPRCEVRISISRIDPASGRGATNVRPQTAPHGPRDVEASKSRVARGRGL